MTPKSIPDGYMENALGHLVPIDQVRESDLLRDRVTLDLAHEAIELHERLKAFKTKALGEIADVISISAERYGVHIGGKKGNVELVSYNGNYKVSRTMAANITFTEELHAAKALIEQCIVSWSDGANENLKSVVMRAFRPNTKGELRTAAVLDLLRLDIDDANWQTAMRALKDSIQASGTTAYIRVYERTGDAKSYRHISLDLAGV